MAPLTIPPDLKKISPFVRRAEELDKDRTSPESRLVAYYCRQYAVHLGIPLSGSSPAAKACLGHLLGSLEQEKPAMDNFTRDEAAFLCRKFATTVFDKADAEDRAGGADKNTAKTFYAAASFLEILQQFADDNENTENDEDKKRVIYSKWKATEILKAIKEGREPTPGGYGEGAMGEIEAHEDKPVERKVDAPPTVETVTEEEGDIDLSQPPVRMNYFPPPAPSTAVSPRPPVPMSPPKEEFIPDDEGTEIELGPPPAYPIETDIVGHNMDRPRLTFDLPPPVQPATFSTIQPAREPTSPKSKMSSLFGFGKKTNNGKITKAQLADAAELTRFALAALEDKDGDLAADRLVQALQALGR